MRRLQPLAGVLRAAASRNVAVIAANSLRVNGRAAAEVAAPQASHALGRLWAASARSIYTSFAAQQESAHTGDEHKQLFSEPERKYRALADKESWHEAWMYEDRFGTPEEPILVPSLEEERIIGVTDPEDENLVVWGILKAGEPPRQFIEGGEYYVLQVVEQVKKVGDVLLELEGSAPHTPIAA